MTETMQPQENPEPPVAAQEKLYPKRADRDAPSGDEIAFVQRLSKLDRGDLAALRRSAGDTIAESQRNVPWFYRLLASADRGHLEEIYFLVATLYGLNNLGDTGDFGHTMWRLSRWRLSRTTSDKAGERDKAIERRFWVLLDAQFGDAGAGGPAGGELSYRLRQLVKLAKSKDVGVNWAQLLHDLKNWGSEGKRTQKRWARSFYPPPDRPPAGGEQQGAGEAPAP